MREGEDFGGVGEGDGAFAGGVEGVVDVDEEQDDAEMSGLVLGNEVGHASGEERPRHVGEREQEQPTPAKGVDCPDGGPGEDEVDEPEAE